MSEIVGMFASFEDLGQKEYIGGLDDLVGARSLKEYAIEVTFDKTSYAIVARPRRWTLCRSECVLQKNSKLVERR